jgi:putative tryptophan/tyrosine transport system substrate-binding protein
MRRRELIKLASGAAVMWPFAGRAQQTDDKQRRIGLLMPYTEGDAEGKARLAAFNQKLQELGWIEGRNLRLDIRWTGPDIDRMWPAAKELVGLQPDLIVTNGTPAVIALKRETHSIPIVFVAAADPLGSGLVTNLPHPGGNITGFTNSQFSLGGKWLQTIKEIAPNVTRAGVLFNTLTATYGWFYLQSIETASQSTGIEIRTLPVGDTAELERAIRKLATSHNVALIVVNDIFTTGNRKLIVALAAELRLPAIYPFRYFVADGGLISYGPNSVEEYPRAASYADRILKGEKPGDLPIEQANKYYLVINLKTAKALGLTISPSILARADEVIE